MSFVFQNRLSYLAYPSIFVHRQGNTLDAFSVEWTAKATFTFFKCFEMFSTLTPLKCLNHFAVCAENIIATHWNDTERLDIIKFSAQFSKQVLTEDMSHNLSMLTESVK